MLYARDTLTLNEKGNLMRVCRRLSGGGTETNLKLICEALKVALPARSGLKYCEAAIELKLRSIHFKQNVTFRPTAHEMTFTSTRFEKAMHVRELAHHPGHYDTIGYSINQLCGILRALPRL